jgi:hypothetical protein
MCAALQFLEVPVYYLRFQSGIQPHPQKGDHLSGLFFGKTHSAPGAGSGGFKSSCRTWQPCSRSVGCRGDLGDRTQPSYPAVVLAVPIPWWKPPELLVPFPCTSGLAECQENRTVKAGRCLAPGRIVLGRQDPLVQLVSSPTIARGYCSPRVVSGDRYS